MAEQAIVTALDGVLVRYSDGWYWCDGTPEPRVQDLTYADAAPEWSILEHDEATVVAIPHDFRRRMPADAGPLMAAIAELVHHHGQPAAIPAPEMDHMTGLKGLQRKGWLVALEHWQRVLNQPHGAAWAIGDEEAILATAEALGYRRRARWNEPRTVSDPPADDA